MPDIEKILYFYYFFIYLLTQFISPSVDLTCKNNSFLAKLLTHLLRSQFPYLTHSFLMHPFSTP